MGRRAAISFMEIMIAISILMVGLIPIIGMFTTNSAMSYKQANYLQGLNALDATLNHVISKGFNKINVNGSHVALLTDCEIQTKTGVKNWESITDSSAGDGTADLAAQLIIGNINYTLSLKIKPIFYGRKDFPDTSPPSTRQPFTFHFKVYTKGKNDSGSPFWADDIDFGSVRVPVVYFKKSDPGIDAAAHEMRYYSPDRIFILHGKISWIEKPKDRLKEIDLVTYKTDLSS